MQSIYLILISSINVTEIHALICMQHLLILRNIPKTFFLIIKNYILCSCIRFIYYLFYSYRYMLYIIKRSGTNMSFQQFLKTVF